MHASAVAELAAQLVAIESVNPALVPGGSGEAEIAAFVAARGGADAGIVVEPTELQVAVAHGGFVGFEIETAGVAAHGSRPDLGVDAIVKMAPVLSALEQLDAGLQTGLRHPLAGAASLHASL